MKYRPLGSSGIKTSVVGLGTWAIGGWMWGGTGEKTAIEAIHAAIDTGINLIDTAPAYGFGISEQIVGKAIRGRRDKVILATKCGLIWHAQKGQFYFNSDETQPTDKGTIKVYRCLAPDVIRYEVEQSLKRLGTDCIDLLQTHWQDPTTPIADTMKTLMSLKAEGKIRSIGCSNATLTQMDEYRATGQLDVDQEKFSMLERKHAHENLPYVIKHGIAFLAYSPLAQGLLTGKIGPDRTFGNGDQRKGNPLFSIENRQRIQKMLDLFKPIAQRHAATLGQLVMAWTLAQPGCSHVLAGARNPEQAVENAKAGKLKLTRKELQVISDAIMAHDLAIPG